MIEPIKVTLKNNCRFIAHRGLALINPENTIEAFKYAATLGYYGMECDIHVTKDEQFVVFHDNNLERMTGKKGLLKNYTFKELRSLNITSGANIEKYQGVLIPNLTEYLEICVNFSIVPVIEIKEVTGYYNLESLVNILKEFKLEDKAIIISFNLNYLVYLRTKYRNLNIQFLSDDISRDNLFTCLKYGFEIDVNSKRLTRDKIDTCLKNNLDINVWTVDDRNLALFLSEYKVKYITTNCLIESQKELK